MIKKDAKYYADRRLKPPKAFWDWCYRDQVTYIWSNKSKTIVASDKKHKQCVTKRLTKNSRLTFSDASKNYQIVLSTSKRIEIQTYRVHSEFFEGKQQMVVDLLNLEILANNEHIKINGSNGGEFGLKPAVGMFNMEYPDIYPNGWLKRLATHSELKYVTLNERYVYPEDLPRIYKYRERIEFLQKIKAPGLADDVIGDSIHVDMRVLTPKFLKNNKQFFRNSRRTYKDFLLKQAIESLGVKMVLGIEEYMTAKDIDKIPPEVGVLKFQNYLIKQGCDINHYNDYVRLLDELNIKRSKSNLFPKDIFVAHDKAVDALNALKREIERKEYESRHKLLQYMEMGVGSYVFILPKTADDLVHEGSVLKHCVGGSHYINQHADGKTTIVFIRRRQDVDTPFYTLEFKDNQVVQVRGLRNQKAPIEVQNAVDQWATIVTKKQRSVA